LHVFLPVLLRRRGKAPRIAKLTARQRMVRHAHCLQASCQ